MSQSVERLIAASSLGTPADGEHVYLSTACLHGQHEHCRSAVAADGGRKKPGTCKFCGAVCVCPVCDHGAESGPRAHLDSRQSPA